VAGVTAFVLHERLARASAKIGDLPLCRILLLNDRRFAWLLLVPRRSGIEEIVDLAKADRTQLIEEIAQASDVLRSLYRPFRLNIADIGNKAEQLHIHIVARHQDDPLWPSVVWSREYERYDEAGLAARVIELQAGFAALPDFSPPPR
jgi:diadenosine tetraphosphate (Ap4A) HIT family hydrolase